MVELASYEYVRPNTMEEILSFLNTHGTESKLIAGGTDLVPMLHETGRMSRYVVDLWGVREGLDNVASDGDFLRIGALTTLATVSRLAIPDCSAASLSVLSEAAGQMGCKETRNLGTVGGNLAAAVPSADMAPPLLALDAVARLQNATNTRDVPVEKVFVGPKQSCIKPNEILTRITVPMPNHRTAAAFEKFGRRRAMSLAVVNVAVKLERIEGECSACAVPTVRNARIALGAVAPTPVRVYDAELWLEGKVLTDTAISEVSSMCVRQARPISDIRASESYRRHLVKVLVERALYRVRDRLMKDAGSLEGQGKGM